MRLIRLAALMLCVFALRPDPAAALARRSVRFVFSGTIMQPNGRPMRGVEVRFVGPGPRDARPALSDREGRFVATAEIPDLSACEREPARLQLHARYRDWNMALPDGSGSLGLELRVVRAAEGDRVEVRSNDAASARIVADDLRGAAGDVVVGLNPRFVRLLGREDASQPRLTALETVTFAPDGAPLPAVAAVRPFAVDSLRAAARGARAVAVSETAPGRSTASLEPAPAPSRPRTELPPEMRLFPSAPDEPIAPPRGRAPDTVAKTVAPVRREPPHATATVTRRAPDSTRVAPRDSTTRDPRGPDTRPPRPKSNSAPILVSMRTDSALAANATPAAGGAALRVAHGVAVAPAGQKTGADCGCEVTGTIEVMSGRPLGASLQVAVWVADSPMLADTVTLFMGSPRSFDLGRFPCGGHRLEIRPLGSRRFVVAAPPASVFPCVEGMQPFRVILQPR
jgi:hypothetical protein